MPGRKAAPRKSRRPRHEQPARPHGAPDLPAVTVAPSVPIWERPAGESRVLVPSSVGHPLVGRPPESERGRVRISDAYRRIIDAPVAPSDLSRPQVAVRKALAQAGPLRIADLLARATISRALDGKARDAIAAMREITDRTEGPVVQKSQVVSARYVVSVSPTGALSESQPAALSLSDWEAQAVEEDEAATARALAEASLAARAEGEE